MSLHLHLASALGAAAALLQLGLPAPTAARAQNDRAPRAPAAAYQITTIYDRVADSTRVTVALTRSSRPFGLGSQAWLDVSFTYPGRELTVPPEAAHITFESVTPARGGWAFSDHQKLRVIAGHTVKLEVTAADYVKQPVNLFDSGRRESLSFRIPAQEFADLTAEPQLMLKAGRATIRLSGREMEMLRELAGRMALVREGGR